jgi:hypothetical protein
MRSAWDVPPISENEDWRRIPVWQEQLAGGLHARPTAVRPAAPRSYGKRVRLDRCL